MYYLVYGSLYVISLLPLRILYFISDFAYFNLYYVFGYRKKVVMDNLRNAFPEKTEFERQKIAKKFYRNLTDTFLESIKLISISKSDIHKHIDADLRYSKDCTGKGKNARCTWAIISIGSWPVLLFLCDPHTYTWRFICR